MDIPQELLTEYERGRVLIFIGQSINGDEWARLASALAAELQERSLAELSTSEVAQEYQDAYGVRALIGRVLDFYEQSEAVHAGHRLLADLTNTMTFVTTCIDERLERAFAEAGRELAVIVDHVDRAYGKAASVARYYKLHGTVSRPDTLRIAEDDIQALYFREGGLSTVLKGHLADNTIVFVGFALDEPFFRQFYLTSIAPLDRHSRRAYVLGGPYSAKVERFCKHNNITLINNQPTEFFYDLLNALQTKPHLPSLTPIEAPLILPNKRPYKGLLAYETRDSEFFFGRHRETEHLLSLILANRLVVLHGAAGAGKTSLLNAGIAPYLETNGYGLISVEIASEMTVAAALKARLTALVYDDRSSGVQVSLAEQLRQATTDLDAPLVIVLDQFEGFFSHFDRTARGHFIGELAETLRRQDLPVKWVLALRSEWFSHLSELREAIPDIFKAEFRLGPLDAVQARMAIVAPLERVGMQIEDRLVDRLLLDLGPDNIEVPEIQIVCSALYDCARGAARNRLLLADYEALGGAKGMLGSYLDDALRRFPATDTTAVRSTLLALVTSEGTPAALSLEELATRTQLNSSQLRLMLHRLQDERLVRATENPGSASTYRLANGFLAHTLAADPVLLTQKAVEEMLRQEISNWQRFGILLGTDKLDFLRGSHAQIMSSTEAAQELILHSALHTGHEIEDWVQQLGGNALCGRVIETYLAPGRPVDAACFAALAAVPYLQDTEHVQRLLSVLAFDPATDPAVRRQAAVRWAQLAPHSVISTLRRQRDRWSALLLDDIFEARDTGWVKIDERPNLPERIRLLGRHWRLNREYVLYTTVVAGLLGGGLGGMLPGLALSWLVTDAGRLLFILGAAVVPAVVGAMIVGGMSICEALWGNQRWSTRSFGGLLGGALGGGLSGLFDQDATIPDLLLGIGIGGMLGGFAGWTLASALTLADTVAPRFRRIVRLSGGLLTGLVFGMVAGMLLIGTSSIVGLQVWHLASIMSSGGLGIALGLHIGIAPFVDTDQFSQVKE